MGIFESTPKSFSTKQQDLTFYVGLKDPNLGDVSIYTSKKMPLCYILKIIREITDSKIYNLFQKIENAQSPCLVSLYAFQMERHYCCNSIIKEIVVSYWEYYNFYFTDYLKSRSQKLSPFSETQFWHVVQSCCQAFIILRKNNCYYDFSPKTMVVTPQGKLKICWAHLMSQNKHLKYFKYFETQQFQPYYFSPEQLQLIHSKQITNKLNFDKCNAFGVGMILIHCLTINDSLKTCYTYDMTKVNFKAINTIIQSKIAPLYSQHVVSLLRQLLNRDPKDRITLIQCQQQYCNFMNDEYQLKVCGSKNSQQNKLLLPQMKHDIEDTKTVKIRRD